MEPHSRSEQGESRITMIQSMPVPFARPFAIVVLVVLCRSGLELPLEIVPATTTNATRPQIIVVEFLVVYGNQILLVVSKPARTKQAALVAGSFTPTVWRLLRQSPFAVTLFPEDTTPPISYIPAVLPPPPTGRVFRPALSHGIDQNRSS